MLPVEHSSLASKERLRYFIIIVQAMEKEVPSGSNKDTSLVQTIKVFENTNAQQIVADAGESFLGSLYSNTEKSLTT